MKVKTEKTAKHKLNAVYFVGIAMIAGVLGLLTQSPMICVITVAVLVAAMIHSGSMRL